MGKLSLADRVVMRRRRREGEKLEAIGADFAVSQQAVSKTCRGVRPRRWTEDRRVHRVLEVVGAELGFGPDWPRETHGRGRPTRRVLAARQAAAVALGYLGLDERDIGRLLFPASWARVRPLLARAEVDLGAVRLARRAAALAHGWAT